ncbi:MULTISPECIES: patatin-like phospholipase family protein [unclassified Shinella]|uniref:patatin-like phospholipase family protein n=1 Tax=Shinella TaxID=323620 RepID=UPI00225D5546|nr:MULTISPECIES: patatin-like phospholipase family protein [unclassified Shinella]MCO5136643.1 patatin-like phospholipase family protein [Shinella sp.]MDC7253680.1 patatin-like phospholipase family protein [Shinella sp. YE25]CAI0336322.1 NTE family protein [Rhizobiaceae bacterium]CAK7254861.1 NTE family protein [Shinella sp. WSC3-e]
MTDALVSANQPQADGPTVAIALGGGGARGLAHIHVIEVLDELGIRPVLISGASIGAVMGAARAAGMTGREIREHTLAAIGHPGRIMNRLWSLRPTRFSEVVARGFRVGQFDLERILKAFLPERLPETFEGLSIPLKIVTADYYAQCECVCDSGPLLPAIAASAALPAVFRPVVIDGRVMIDGGLWNPVPFDHLLGKADITIGVDVIGHPPAGTAGMPNSIDSLYGATQLTMRSIVTLKLEKGAPDIFLRPDVGRFRVLDFVRAEEVLAASAGIRDELKRALDEKLSAV